MFRQLPTIKLEDTSLSRCHPQSPGTTRSIIHQDTITMWHSPGIRSKSLLSTCQPGIILLPCYRSHQHHALAFHRTTPISMTVPPSIIPITQRHRCNTAQHSFQPSTPRLPLPNHLSLFEVFHMSFKSHPLPGHSNQIHPSYHSVLTFPTYRPNSTARGVTQHPVTKTYPIQNLTEDSSFPFQDL